MIDIQGYIVDGRVAREKIAMDIKYRKLNRADLENIIADPRIQQAFIGHGYSDKVPKKQWTNNYLEKLSYAVVAEGFNKDYLLYLNEVAEYVTNKNKNVRNIIKIIILIGAFIVLIAGLVKKR